MFRLDPVVLIVGSQGVQFKLSQGISAVYTYFDNTRVLTV